jgi:hypothetical protein
MEEQAISPLEYYYDKQNDETKSCLLALKSIIMSVDPQIVHFRKYQIPFFRYKNFGISFLWVNKKKILLGFIVDKKVIPQENGLRQKDGISTLEINPLDDIPVEQIKNELRGLIEWYHSFLDKS